MRDSKVSFPKQSALLLFNLNSSFLRVFSKEVLSYLSVNQSFKSDIAKQMYPLKQQSYNY